MSSLSDTVVPVLSALDRSEVELERRLDALTRVTQSIIETLESIEINQSKQIYDLETEVAVLKEAIRDVK